MATIKRLKRNPKLSVVQKRQLTALHELSEHLMTLRVAADEGLEAPPWPEVEATSEPPSKWRRYPLSGEERARRADVQLKQKLTRWLKAVETAELALNETTHWPIAAARKRWRGRQGSSQHNISLQEGI